MHAEPARDIPAAIRRLQGPAAERRFRQEGFHLVVVHGSAARGEESARDLDLAVRFDHDRHGLLSAFTLLEEIVAPLAGDLLDVMDLSRAGVLATARALGPGCLPIFEDPPGRFAEAQTVALARYLDDRWLRDELLASLQPAA